MFLQLHDGPEMPYGIQKYPYPKFTGPMRPVRSAENPYAAGAPVMQLSPFAVLSGCDPQQIYAEFVKPDAAGWKVTVSTLEQGKKIWKDYQTIRQAAGTGSAPVYDADGNITGFKQAGKVEEALAWYELGLKLGRFLRGTINAAEARRLTEDAQKLWDENKWGLQNVCTQSMQMLQTNAQNCYDSLQWWLADQGKPGRSAGQKRVANRAVLLRQSALLILVKQIEEKGGMFTPGQKGAAPINAAGLVAALAALAFLRF
jgi:YD repeat-containing protein